MGYIAVHGTTYITGHGGRNSLEEFATMDLNIICFHWRSQHFLIEMAIHKSSNSRVLLKIYKRIQQVTFLQLRLLNGQCVHGSIGAAPVSCHLMVVQKMKSFINQSKSLLISHKWVRSKQFRQEVTFCVVKMVLSSVYRKFFSKKTFYFVDIQLVMCQILWE